MENNTLVFASRRVPRVTTARRARGRRFDFARRRAGGFLEVSFASRATHALR
jgi:hypothetical protein